MMDAINVEHYTYRVSWSEMDQEYVGTVLEFPTLSWMEEDQISALRGIRDLVAEVIVDMRSEGEVVPQPISASRLVALSQKSVMISGIAKLPNLSGGIDPSESDRSASI